MLHCTALSVKYITTIQIIEYLPLNVTSGVDTNLHPKVSFSI
jgi:hypothetical protein